MPNHPPFNVIVSSKDSLIESPFFNYSIEVVSQTLYLQLHLRSIESIATRTKVTTKQVLAPTTHETVYYVIIILIEIIPFHSSSNNSRVFQSLILSKH